jgi:tetratricopeptide (TPR) repeat protein
MLLRRTLAIVLTAVLSCIALAAFSNGAQAQQLPRDCCVPVPQMDSETATTRKQAMDLFEQAKYEAAIPFFEKVLTLVPTDVAAQETFARCVLHYAAALSDPAQRRAERVRARKEFLRAKDLGDNSDLLAAMLASLPEDGHEPSFSRNPDVDRWMQKAETAFYAGKFDEAKHAYLQAFTMDPQLYQAALFIGDADFRKGDFAAAQDWFVRATEIDPMRETAYRYWGDALLKQARIAAAREKFIDAVICNPYSKQPWSGVNNFLRAVNKPAVYRRVKSPVASESIGENGLAIQVSPHMPMNDGSTAWLGYPSVHQAWQNGKVRSGIPERKRVPAFPEGRSDSTVGSGYGCLANARTRTEAELRFGVSGLAPEGRPAGTLHLD